MTKKQKLLLAGIIVLAVFFRFYLIKQMPGGLFPDEAANGLDINLMQQGHLQPFYERGNGREALFFYLEWGSVAVFGKGAWQHHIVSAAIGALAVVACFMVTRRLLEMGYEDADEESKKKNKHRSTNIALLAAFLMAVSSWHVVLSRTAFRATMIPLFTSLTFYFLIATYQSITTKKRYWFSFLTGAVFALGFYTYIAYRIMIPIFGMLVLWPLLADIFKLPRFEGIKKYVKPLVIFVIAFVIFIYPIAKYFYTHPGSFVGRAGQVSVFNPSLYTVNGQQLSGVPPLPVVVSAAAEVFKAQLLAIFTHGDLNWRQNISGFPFLSPLVSPLFAVAILVVSVLGIGYFFMPRRRAGWWKYFLLTMWFWVMMLPVVTTAEGIPHGLRGIGIIPPLFIVSALGLYVFAEQIWKLHTRLHNYTPETSGFHAVADQPSLRMMLIKFLFKTVIVCFVVALILQTYFLYFVYAANSPDNFYSFRSDLTPVSCYLMYYGNKNDTYLVLDKFSVQTTDYITFVDGYHPSNARNNPYVQVDPENSWELPTLKPGDQVVFTQSSIFDTTKFKKYHPEAHLTQELRNKFGQAVMAVYTVPNQPDGKFKKLPYDYSSSHLLIPGQCTSMFGPGVYLY